jgi:predicted metalloenzyme YecM
VSDVRAHDVQFTNLPPEEWKERVRNIETELRMNQIDHTSIKVSLEQIKAKLGVADGP